MKILVSAYACEPHKGSEPGKGWNWALQAAQCGPTWVITRRNNKDAIESELSRTPIPNINFIYHDLPTWVLRFKRGHISTLIYYYLWQLTALFPARAAHQTFHFDVAHHVSMASFRFGSFLPFLGVPYVWGPIGGGERPPLRVYSLFGPKGICQQLIRDVSNLVSRFDPLVRLTAKRAKVILATSPSTRSALPRGVRQKTQIMQTLGIDLNAISNHRSTHADDNRVTRFLFVGRLLYWKGAQVAILALSQIVEQGIPAQLTIVGSGPYGARLAHLVSELKLNDHVIFAGPKAREEVLELYARHDALVFPSFQDSGGFVVLEAMASGLPVICLRIGGPSITVSNGAGIAVEPKHPRQIVTNIAESMRQLALDPTLRSQIGKRARSKATTHYSWERKRESLQAVYDQLVAIDKRKANSRASGKPVGATEDSSVRSPRHRGIAPETHTALEQQDPFGKNPEA